MLRTALKLIAGIAAGSIALTSAAYIEKQNPQSASQIADHETIIQNDPDDESAIMDSDKSSQNSSTPDSASVKDDQNDRQNTQDLASAPLEEQKARIVEEEPVANNQNQNSSNHNNNNASNEPSVAVQAWNTTGGMHTGAAVSTPTASLPQKAEPSGKAFQHHVGVEFIDPELTGKYSDAFLEDIRDGRNQLYYEGDASQAEYSLSEIVSFYCSLTETMPYYETQDGSGTYLEMDPDVFARLQAAVRKADQGWADYTSYVANADASLQLYTTDRNLVDQINAYICDNFDYEVTNSGMPRFLETGKGQCWHYAKLFADMCNAAGIQAWKVENEEHAWNQVVVDGKTYTFDPTFNDTSANHTEYSWQS